MRMHMTVMGVLVCVALAFGLSAQAGELTTVFTAGELARAAQVRDRATAPDDAADAATRCKLFMFENRLDQATACLERRLSVTPDDPSLLGSLALTRFRADDFAGAAKLYARAGRTAKAAEAAALAAAPAYRVTGGRAEYRVPFAQRDPLPILQVGLPDGKQHAFVLDTGAAETVIDPTLADALSLTLLDGAAAGTFAGGKTAAVRFAILGRLSLGALVIERVPVLLLSTAGFSAALGGVNVDGVIGMDILRRFTTTIDYPGARLVLRDPAGSPAPARAGFHFWLAGDHLLLTEGAINGVRELALVDTGLAGQGCTLPQSTLAAVDEAPNGETITGVGGGGAISAISFTARSLSLGPVSRADVPCLSGPFPPTLETATGAHIGLLVSHTFLQPYALTIDFRAMRMTLADRVSPPMRQIR